MLTVYEREDGTMLVQSYEEIEYFSLSLLERSSPFIDLHDGMVTVMAANGRWKYRLVGWDRSFGFGKNVRAKLVEHITFDVQEVW